MALPDPEPRQAPGHIDERLDRIVDLMERMVASVDELRGSVEELQEHVEPVGRLAGRFPGRSKR